MDRTQLAAITFSLQWRSAIASHCDRYHSPKVDFWRDFFPADLETALSGAGPGEQVSKDFPVGELVEPWQAALVKSLPRTGFQTSLHGMQIEPVTGRFFPRGVVSSVTQYFPGEIIPMRVLSVDEQQFSADFNHPLARYPLSLTATVDERFAGREQRGGTCQDIAEMVTEKGPGLYAPDPVVATEFYRTYPFERVDTNPDPLFYVMPRMVHHIDEVTQQQLRDLYARFLQPGMRVLDVMSSWVSHLPEDADCQLDAIGMNQEELDANPRLSLRKVQDLNAQPQLPFDDASYDLVLCSLSVEYLTDPLAVFAEVQRVMKPGAIFICSFSERWFPTKAIRLWSEMHPFERIGLVLDLYLRSGFSALQTESLRGLLRPNDDKYRGMSPFADPLYAVWGVK